MLVLLQHLAREAANESAGAAQQADRGSAASTGRRTDDPRVPRAAARAALQKARRAFREMYLDSILATVQRHAEESGSVLSGAAQSLLARADDALTLRAAEEISGMTSAMLPSPGTIGLTPVVLTLSSLATCGVARAAAGPIMQLALNESG